MLKQGIKDLWYMCVRVYAYLSTHHRSNNCGLIFVQAVGHVLLDGLIAALGTAVGGLVVLPTLASHSLRREVAETLMKVGHSLSG